MTFTQVSPTDEDTVGALGEGVDDEIGVDHAGAHDPDDAAVGRILDPRDPGQIGAGIGAPVAEKGDDQGFELIRHNEQSPLLGAGAGLRLWFLLYVVRAVRTIHSPFTDWGWGLGEEVRSHRS